MKRIFASVSALIALASCQNDTANLLKTIDGRWQVNSVIYSGGAARDSTTTLNAAFLTFDRCSSSANGSGPTNCTAQFSTGSQSFGFTYQAPNAGKSLYLSPTSEMKDPSYRSVADQIAGSYEVLTLSDNVLVIRRAVTNGKSPYQYVQYSASK